ncbi:MAG: hypothetical protein ACJ79S_05775 [Gemmatimonadaceae bacterium]
MPDDPTPTDPAGLETALRAAGIPCVVDAHDRLAVIVPGPGGLDLRDPALRRRATELLPAFGFTHLALELVDGGGAPSGASSSPAPSTVPGAPLRRD